MPMVGVTPFYSETVSVNLSIKCFHGFFLFCNLTNISVFIFHFFTKEFKTFSILESSPSLPEYNTPLFSFKSRKRWTEQYWRSRVKTFKQFQNLTTKTIANVYPRGCFNPILNWKHILY